MNRILVVDPWKSPKSFPRISHSFSTEKNDKKSFNSYIFREFIEVFHIPMAARFFLLVYNNRHKLNFYDFLS
jgi:hypothetical protein